MKIVTQKSSLKNVDLLFMKKEDLRIVFMGTPEFAVASLAALVDNGFNVVGVVTATDKPAGRGMQLQASAVKKYALEKGLPILQPEKLKNPEFIASLKSLEANIQVVVAFRMLPEVVWNMPALGTLNVHGSLLPNYRGAAPINWAIINGEKETGVTTFKLKHEIDTGNILLQEKIAIAETDTAGILHDKMKAVGAVTLIKTLNQLIEGNLKEIPQDNLPVLFHAPKIFTATCKIDWNKSTLDIYNLIRGLSPYPAAFTLLHNKIFKLYEVEKEITSHNQVPGQISTDRKSYLRFSTADGFINCITVQLEGKRKMNISEFLRGYQID